MAEYFITVTVIVLENGKLQQKTFTRKGKTFMNFAETIEYSKALFDETDFVQDPSQK